MVQTSQIFLVANDIDNTDDKSIAFDKVMNKERTSKMYTDDSE